MPRFSIVVPAYQAQATLGETLDAIQGQTFADWECVVVDDGSTDDTASIATEYAHRDPRIRTERQENQGSAGAYNTGVALAKGDFIVICSADDMLLPEHLERMSEFIDAEAGYDIYSSNGFFWWPGVKRVPAYTDEPWMAVRSLALADVIHRCFFGVGATYRRELFAKVGGYRVGVYGEDYDFWLRALASGARHRYLPEALALHRVSATQKSAQLETVYRSDIRLISELRRDFPLPAAASRAVDDAIVERESLIANVNERPVLYRRVVRPIAKPVAIALLGRDRAQRLATRLSLMLRRRRRRSSPEQE